MLLAANTEHPTLGDVINAFSELLSEVKGSIWSSKGSQQDAWTQLQSKTYHEYITNTTEWVVSKGLNANTFLLNGLVLDSFEYSQSLLMTLAR